VLNTARDASERLLVVAETVMGGAGKKAAWDAAIRRGVGRTGTVEERLQHALLKGRRRQHIEATDEEARKKYDTAAHVIEGPLMDGMNVVGDLFGRQDVPAAGRQDRARDEAGRRPC
jgi:5-methyltetrahydrofolate--homocysteine methyltransferase